MQLIEPDPGTRWYGKYVAVVAQEKDGSATYFVFFHTKEDCEAAYGILKDTAPKGSDLDKYR